MHILANTYHLLPPINGLQLACHLTPLLLGILYRANVFEHLSLQPNDFWMKSVIARSFQFVPSKVGFLADFTTIPHTVTNLAAATFVVTWRATQCTKSDGTVLPWHVPIHGKSIRTTCVFHVC